MELKEYRKSKKITQKQAADFLSVPLRTYVRYENDKNRFNSKKYKRIYVSLQDKLKIDEEHGILTINEIKLAVCEVLIKYDVEFAYLFGSYAKGKEKPESDVDLMVCTDLTGLDFYEMVEELRTALNKKVDVLRLKDIKIGSDIMTEILRVGIRIYGKK